MSKKGADKKDKDYEVGYKKPPRRSQFQPGKSGNPNGRPKKTEEIADILQKELNTMVPILKNGKRRKISMLRAILRQHLMKAAAGDPKAAAIVLSALKSFKPDGGDNLGAVLQQLQAIHVARMEAERNDGDKGKVLASETVVIDDARV